MATSVLNSIKPCEVTIKSRDLYMAEFNAFRPPYNDESMEELASLATIILAQDKGRRLSKYQLKDQIRIVFQHDGIIKFFTHFKKEHGIKNTKLGDSNNMSFSAAKLKAAEIYKKNTSSHTFEFVVSKQIENLQSINKHSPSKLAETTVTTYTSYLNAIQNAFGKNTLFQTITPEIIEATLDQLLTEKSGPHVAKLFEQMKKLWVFAKNKYNNGTNPFLEIDNNYISSRTAKPIPCKAYTDISLISQLYINLKTAKNNTLINAVLLMMFTGLRPINICNLRLSYIDDLDNPKFLTFPETTHTARGAMKNQKEFKIQLTPEMEKAIKQELKLNPDINRTYLFCKVKDDSKPISKESLNRALKYHAPKDMVVASRDNINIKGSAGAFPTLLRSFLKSHMKEVLTKKIGSSTIAEIESKKMLHHSVLEHDPMSKHYDHSNKIYNTDIKALYKNFSLFEKEILKEVKIQAKLKNKTTKKSFLKLDYSNNFIAKVKSTISAYSTIWGNIVQQTQKLKKSRPLQILE